MTSDASKTALRVDDSIPHSVTAFLHSQANVKRVHFLTRLVGRNPIPRRLHPSFLEASADVAVIDALSQLGPDWLVRSQMSADSGKMEYLVVGPSGIFSLIVRHHPAAAVWIDGGVLLADGERLSDVRDSEFCAVRLAQLMSDAVESRVEVIPCLVLVGQRSLTVAKPPRRVAVMTVRDIRGWLRGLNKVMSVEELQSAQKGASAQPELHAVGDKRAKSHETLSVFRKLQAEVVQARHLRLTWVTGILVVAWLVAVVGIGGMTTNFLTH